MEVAMTETQMILDAGVTKKRFNWGMLFVQIIWVCIFTWIDYYGYGCWHFLCTDTDFHFQ